LIFEGRDRERLDRAPAGKKAGGKGGSSGCEISAYGCKGGREELLLESLVRVEPQEKDSWRLLSLFGEKRVLAGRFRGGDFRQNRVFFDVEEG